MTNQKHTKHSPSPKVKSTPGPWIISSRDLGPNGLAYDIDSEAGAIVASDLALGDARLIAAAPELLQNLKQVVACLEFAVNALEAPEKSSIRENLALAKQAIAKAEGGK